LYIQNVPDCEKLCVLVSIVSEKWIDWTMEVPLLIHPTQK
jgi:hypothetical protein